jgi:hypothetical protein
MKTRVLALSLICYSSALLAGLAIEKPSVPGFKLQLEEQLHLTDTQGVFIPKQMVAAPIGKKVKIYRTDGFCYEGMVTTIEETDDSFRIYGTIDNVKATRFGFVMAKGGIFAGAVLENDGEKAYALEFSEAHKGFVLVRAYKHDKAS